MIGVGCRLNDGGGSIAHARDANRACDCGPDVASRAPETQFPRIAARRKKCVHACRSDMSFEMSVRRCAVGPGVVSLVR